jgi:hypothetical protein
MNRVSALTGLILGLVSFLPLLPSPTYAQSSEQSYHSLQFSNRYIRHRNSLAYIEPINSELDSKDATFVMVPGLANRDCYSFEARYIRGQYLRHQNSRLKLAKFENQKLFTEDATFCFRDGLVRAPVCGVSSCYSFESFNFPKQFIRQRDFELMISPDDGSIGFKRDATFIQTGPVRAPGKFD